MNEQTLSEHLQESLGENWNTPDEWNLSAESNEGLLTNDTGFVVRADGKRFHVTVQEF